MWEKMNGLEKFFRAYGVLEIICGVILAFIFVFGNSGYGNVLGFAGYTVSFISLAVGILFGAIFIAVGNALYYLRNTMEKTNDIYSSLQRTTTAALPVGINPSISSPETPNGMVKAPSEEGSWICPVCQKVNLKHRETCWSCELEGKKTIKI
jgi:hypothetical protein